MSDFYIYADEGLTQFGLLSVPELATATERHRVRFTPPSLQDTSDITAEIERAQAPGVVISLSRGWPGLGNLRFAGRMLRRGKKAFFFWPAESAIEVIDQERLRSYRHLWYALAGYTYALSPFIQTLHLGQSPNSTAELQARKLLQTELSKLAEIRDKAQPATLQIEPGCRIPGTGVYLRTDYWAPIASGGSYGHTCYVARGLARVTERFTCLLPSRYPLLDEWGIHQVELPSLQDGNESSILKATSYYLPILKTAIRALKPTYIYERLCLGNYCGAQISRELGLPYIVEYNGSEISMKRSFDGSSYQYENFYLAAEEAAFKQATLISVVSELIKDDLVKRGIPESKILINPNAVDIEDYKPVDPSTKAALRKELGWNGTHRVVGFIGTFGGWHGVEVLSKAIPDICSKVPEARFLLIGDGSYKNLVDSEVRTHKLEDRVHSCGRVPQREGARLLNACDVFVSPHSRNMVDSRFFGSPTKIFEYMALGGAIVASDLEQIGEVLSPALRPAELEADSIVTNQRSILCRPGNITEFVQSVEYLLRHPQTCSRLGQNARAAVTENYTWDNHVRRLFESLATGNTRPFQQVARPAAQTNIDDYKNQTQQQWNNDPCGSQYSKGAEPHTLTWFTRAESYRYEEYAPWMPATMEFENYRGKRVLEIGAGLGTDLAQFARNGALVTDADLSIGHLTLARENFQLRQLPGQFIQTDAEILPFATDTFDLVYTNGVIHHSPDTAGIVSEIYRILRPGGKVIAMVYAENSWHYWYGLVYGLGVLSGLLKEMSIGEIMSCSVEMGTTGARPLVKVYTKRRLKEMFRRFSDIRISQRQLIQAEVPRGVRKFLSAETASKIMGWNLILKASKPVLN